MEQNFDTSFIPKRPIFKEDAGVRRHQPVSVVTLIGFAVFFAALILTGITFYINKKESAAVETLAAKLASEKENFNPQAIEELKAISARLKFAKDVVDNHVAVSPLLDLIQSFTNKSVYYESLDLVREEKTGYELTLRGKAPSFGLLYAQMSSYRAESKVRTVEVGNVQLDERTGGVQFEVKIGLSPEVMKYLSPVAPPAVISGEQISAPPTSEQIPPNLPSSR